jgi:hypothetical protein
MEKFEPHALPAGEYVVGDVGCYRKSFRGPHAKFLVQAGEFVDVGVLTFETKQDLGDVLLMRGALRRAVGPADQKHVDKLKEEAPVLMTKLVRRPMVIPGPEEVRMNVRAVRSY